MSVNLFGNVNVAKEFQCSVYHDEREIPDRWLYHGFLFVPVNFEESLLQMLATKREESTWEKEIHFSDLKDTRTMNNLAVKWIKLFCCSLYDKTYFYFFGVDYNNLTKDLWDNKKTRDFKIYNRFFQIGLYGAIKWFFLNLTSGFQKVVIQNIFSDAKSRRPQDKFHTQPITKIDSKAIIRNEPITFKRSAVIEVDSCHYKEKKYTNQSHIIQYLDLVIGGLSQVFDDTSNHEGKLKVARTLIERRLPEKIMGYNINSIYYKKYALSFFPKYKLSKEDIMDKKIFAKRNQFYNKRTLAFYNRVQINLFKEPSTFTK